MLIRLKDLTLISTKTNKQSKEMKKRKRENKLKCQLICEKGSFYKSKINSG